MNPSKQDRILTCLVILAVSLLFQGIATAQQIKNNDLIHSESILSSQRNRIEKQINALKKETGDLRTTISNPDLPDIEFGSPLLEIPQDIENVRDIHERIELLKRIYANRKRASEKERLESHESFANSMPPITPEPVFRNLNVGSSNVSPNNDAELPRPELDDENKNDAIGLASMTRMLNHPVNSFEMANSLFQTGELPIALKAYESVDRKQLTAFDLRWLDFMTATCHRKLGNRDDAMGIYRNLANKPLGDGLDKASTWWLKHFESTANSKQTMSQIESELKELVEKAKAHGKR